MESKCLGLRGEILDIWKSSSWRSDQSDQSDGEVNVLGLVKEFIGNDSTFGSMPVPLWMVQLC